MRVAGLDFNDTSTSCPSGLRERVDSGIRTCGIESSEAACPSVMFSTSGVEYTKVCGPISLVLRMHLVIMVVVQILQSIPIT